MRLKDSFIALFVVALIAGLGWLWLAPTGMARAPDVAFTSLDGERIELAELRGQPLLVTFWATDCPGCIKEMPHLIELHREFSARGLHIVGIAMPYDRPDHVLRMRAEKDLPYTIALDSRGELTEAFGQVRLTPTSFLIAPDGRIVQQKIGEMDMEQVRDRIRALLG